MPNYQTITVDITPGAKEKPVLNASQFDNGRPFAVALTWEGVPFTDAGDFDIEIHVKKPDGNIVTAEPDTVVNDVCSFLTTEQMCACHGNNECEIVLLDNDIQIGTGNFILDVEKAPDEGGIQSASDIHNLTQQIAQIVPEVLGDDYYNKTQTDALLANKADISDLPDMTNYYDKSQTDTLLAAKADTSSLASVAFSGDYNDLINTPVIPTQVQADYTQEDTTAVDYIKNKPDINAMIADALLAIMPVETSGPSAVCNFNTDIATNLVNVKCTIVASGGGGTPSTPIPIVGHSELNLTRCGSNFLDISHLVNKRFDEIPSVNNVITENKMPIKGGVEYAWHTVLADVSGRYVEFYDSNDTYISEISFYGVSDRTFTAPNNAASFRTMWYYGSGISSSDITADCINIGSTPTAYAPYNGQTLTVQFGQTVYGGELDVTSGVLTITYNDVDIGDLNWIYNSGAHRFQAIISGIKRATSATDLDNGLLCEVLKPDSAPIMIPYPSVDNTICKDTSTDNVYVICSAYSDATAFKTAMTGKKIAYELATPQTVQLTPTQVQAILGDNNVFADTGDTEVKYKVSIQKYVDDQ